jgi:type 1 glutamine amidotransferase
MARLSRRTWMLAGALLVCSCASDNPASPTPAAGPARVLVVTHTEGFRHSSIPIAETTLEALGRSSGAFTVQYCRTADDVTRMLIPSALAGTDAIVFANTSGSLPVPDLPALLNWIGQGHGFAGTHSASDTYHDRPEYLDMLGNEVVRHGEPTTVEAIVENPSHPASSPLGQRFRVFDEIYLFREQNRSRVTILLSLDRHPDDGLPEAGQPGDLPLAWVKDHGQGRVFYTALGHHEDVWRNPLYQQHVLGGIRWVLRRQ